MIPHPFHNFVNYSHTILIILKIVSSSSTYSRTRIHHIATKLYFKQFKNRRTKIEVFPPFSVRNI